MSGMRPGGPSVINVYGLTSYSYLLRFMSQFDFANCFFLVPLGISLKMKLVGSPAVSLAILVTTRAASYFLWITNENSNLFRLPFIKRLL